LVGSLCHGFVFLSLTPGLPLCPRDENHHRVR
jgi:hypothetical protein